MRDDNEQNQAPPPEAPAAYDPRAPIIGPHGRLLISGDVLADYVAGVLAAIPAFLIGSVIAYGFAYWAARLFHAPPAVVLTIALALMLGIVVQLLRKYHYVGIAAIVTTLIGASLIAMVIKMHH